MRSACSKSFERRIPRKSYGNWRSPVDTSPPRTLSGSSSSKRHPRVRLASCSAGSHRSMSWGLPLNSLRVSVDSSGTSWPPLAARRRADRRADAGLRGRSFWHVGGLYERVPRRTGNASAYPGAPRRSLPTAATPRVLAVDPAVELIQAAVAAADLSMSSTWRSSASSSILGWVTASGRTGSREGSGSTSEVSSSYRRRYVAHDVWS